MREMIETTQKYNTLISVMRAPGNLRLSMPAFHHPFAKNRNLHTKSKTMKCLQDNHKARTIGDLIRISMTANQTPCRGNEHQNNECRNKAIELLNWVKDKWNLNKENPQRHNLWHTPQRIKKNAKVNLMMTSVLYNPDTRTTHNTLGGIRIFGKAQGHKSTKRDPYLPENISKK